MGSTLYLSTDLQALAGRLSSQLDSGAGAGDLFAPATIVVPNPYLGKWLKLHLARAQGIVANFRVEYLEDCLWRLLQELDGRSHPAPLELLHEADYRLMVLAALLDARPGAAELAPLQDYLGPAGQKAGRDYWRRAWQLAARLASLIRNYEYHRQDQLIHAWLKLETPGQLPLHDSPLERSQRAIFQRIVDEPDGLRHRLGSARGKVCKTLPQYAGELRDLPASELETGKSSIVHFFGLTQISALHVRTLRWLGQWHDLRVYHANPLLGRLNALPAQPSQACVELRALADQFRGARGADRTGDELLASWGRAGAEGLWLLAGLLEAKKSAKSRKKGASEAVQAPAVSEKPFAVEQVPAPDHAEQTVLGQLQAVLRGTSAAFERVVQDRSVQVVGCPGVEREVETVYHSILQNLDTDARLKQTDIAVLVTDMAGYWPVFRAVFDRSHGRLAYNLAAPGSGALSSYGHAVLGLMDLALESFARSKVLEVLLNPWVLERLGVDREQALQWLEWAQELGVFHAWDEQDKRERGYTASPLYSWKLGLRRLRLGRLMEVADERASGPALRYKGVIPFTDLASSDLEQLDAFTRAVEGLLPRLARLRAGAFPAGEWARLLRRLFDDVIQAPPPQTPEYKARETLFQSLETLAHLDALRGQADAIPLALVREFLREQLESNPAQRGESLTGGVTIARLADLMPIPFRILYVVGLGEGLFPGIDPRSSLDLLRTGTRAEGDVLPTEANRFLFLQALLAAQDKVYLLYNAQDLQKDHDLHPCGPLNQLRRHLEKHTLAAKPFEFARAPLWLGDPRYLEGKARADGDAQSSAQRWDVMTHYSEPHRLLALDQAGKKGRLKLDARQKTELERLLAKSYVDFAVPSEVPSAEARPVNVSIRELAEFLRCPAEAMLKRHLFLTRDDDEGEDDEPVDDEPFWTRFPANYSLASAALERFVNRALKDSVSEAHLGWKEDLADLHDEWRLRGRAPEDAFAEVDRQGFEEWLGRRMIGQNGLEATLGQLEKNEPVGPLLLGDTLTVVEGGQRFPALELDLGGHGDWPKQVRLVGDLSLAWRSQEAIDALVLTNKTKVNVFAKSLNAALFRPLLFALALKASTAAGAQAEVCRQWLGDRRLRIHVVHEEGVHSYLFQMQKISPDQGLAYLADLVRDFLDPKGFDLLPFDILGNEEELKFAYKPGAAQESAALTYAEILQQKIDEDAEKPFPSYRPAGLVRLADPKVPQDAFDKVRRRFRLLDEALEPLGKAQEESEDG